MTSNRRQSSSFLALTFGGWAALASAQTTADTLTGGAGTPANTAPSTLTGAAGTPSVVLEQEARDANDGLFRILNPNFSKPLGVAGGTGEVRGSLPLAPQFGVSLLEWQARPEDAQIQLGNLYLQFRALSAQLLVSDNVDQTEINRRSSSHRSPPRKPMRHEMSGAWLCVGKKVTLPFASSAYAPFRR